MLASSRHTAAVILLYLFNGAFPDTPVAGERPTTTQRGVFLVEQAQRGEELIMQNCSQCHGESLRGGPGAPGLVGVEFKANWSGKSLQDLFERIRATMPPGQVGSIADSDYIDILAGLLQANNNPPAGAGDQQLDPAALRSIQFEATERLNE